MTTDKSPEGVRDEAPELRVADMLLHRPGPKLDALDYTAAATIQRLHARVQELERNLDVVGARDSRGSYLLLRRWHGGQPHFELMCFTARGMEQMSREEMGFAAAHLHARMEARIRPRGVEPLRSPACWCQACDVADNGGWRSRMSLCPQCGDKRCPRAEQHDNQCSARGAQKKGGQHE